MPQAAVVQQQPVAPAVEKVEVKEEVKPEKQVVQAETYIQLHHRWLVRFMRLHRQMLHRT